MLRDVPRFLITKSLLQRRVTTSELDVAIGCQIGILTECSVKPRVHRRTSDSDVTSQSARILPYQGHLAVSRLQAQLSLRQSMRYLILAIIGNAKYMAGAEDAASILRVKIDLDNNQSQAGVSIFPNIDQSGLLDPSCHLAACGQKHFSWGC